MLSRQVRLPLQTGSAAAGHVVAAFITGIPLVLILGIGARNPGPALIIGAFALALFGFVSYLILLSAKRRQASDVILGAAGLTIESGPADGLSVPWSDVEPDSSKVDAPIDPRRPHEPPPNAEMYLFRHSDEAVLLASTNDREERLSFEALLACIRASCAGPPPEPRRQTEVLACPRCGASTVPADVVVIACRFCEGRVVVPEELRARIRASRTLLTSPDAMLAARLISQPGAKRVNRTLIAGLVIYFVGAPISLFLGAEIGALVAAAGLFVCIAIARTFIADRVALRSLVLGFGAHAPSRQGAPETCRVCGAPLPAVDHPAQTLVPCAFCSALNLSGIDLRADAAVARSAEVELRSALVDRKSRRIRAYLFLFVTLTLLGGVGAIAYRYAMRSF